MLLPSLGRGASDFDALVTVLSKAGHRAIALEPLPSAPDGVTLHDLAAEVVGAMDALSLDRVHLVGHAFGQRLARCVAADHPGRVLSLTMLAAGGMTPIDEDIARSLMLCFDESLSADEHLLHVRRVFFAPGNDPAVWADGWMPEVAAYQAAAARNTPAEDWQHAVAPHVLVLQAMQDACAVPANAQLYVDAHRDVARLVEINGAGHAMLPERPVAIAAALLDFLADIEATG